MSACGYKFYLQVFNSIYHKWAQWTSEISSWILEDKICIRKRACNILFIIQTPMARYCYALFLLAETDVAITTMISSHVKDKNCIFTWYQSFVTGKILVFHRCLYNKYIYYSFKIFPRFWLAKSTCIIHHNQLLMTKFERILCLMHRWPQKCSFFAG